MFEINLEVIFREQAGTIRRGRYFRVNTETGLTEPFTKRPTRISTIAHHDRFHIKPDTRFDKINSGVLIGSVRGRDDNFVDQFRFRVDRNVAFVTIETATATLMSMAGFGGQPLK